MQFFICLDNECTFFNQPHQVKRSSFKNHVEKKEIHKLRSLLKFYDATSHPEFFNYFTIINMYIDCCRGKIARQLLDKFHTIQFKDKDLREYF